MVKQYKHIKSGAIIDSTSLLIGTGWELVDGNNEKPKEETVDEYVEEEVNLEEMTNQQLDDFAKEHKIELSSDDKRNKSTRINAIAKAFE